MIAIFLLLQVASSNAFAEELIKIPKLFTHFYHHSREHKDTSDFFDFLHKHYSDHHQDDKHSQKHNGEDNDCNLPFKHCGNCCLNIHAPAIGFIPSAVHANTIITPINNSNFVSEDDQIESSDLASIWQPPKLA